MQIAVLADMNWRGTPTKAMLWANRNGYFYVLDRATGRFLSGTPFVKVNWASGLDAKGRPIPTPQPAGQPTWPGNQGGTNWYSPSFSPRTGAVLRLGVGRLRDRSTGRKQRVRARAQISAAAAPRR